MEPSWTDVGSGWFLDRVEVNGPGDQKLTFPCNTWLGKSDAGDYDGDTCPAPGASEREHVIWIAYPM